jgi:ferredoxin/flavodoxin---NADP+ reductase
VIGTNKKDATETVELLLADAREGRLRPGEPVEALDALLEERGVEAVLYEGWGAIDVLERARGDEQGRPRVKLATWDELLATAARIGAS